MMFAALMPPPAYALALDFTFSCFAAALPPNAAYSAVATRHATYAAAFDFCPLLMPLPLMEIAARFSAAFARFSPLRAAFRAAIMIPIAAFATLPTFRVRCVEHSI